MYTESEFNLIRFLSNKQFIKRESFSTDSEFEYSCDLALEMRKKGILSSQSQKPYVINHTGHGTKYEIVGKLNLSIEAQDTLKFNDFKAYAKITKKSSQWNLGNRLSVFSIIIAILGVAVAIFLAN
ncbi:hypothetical protein [Shewanella sp. HN-41]|uniref:hypothetical protein n=1 Tax=Shewanella sp. HN-41 TaxID=327275 RepID=UPI00055DA3BA|nr:hypothetical protein [Shewanella sp. HN-41]